MHCPVLCQFLEVPDHLMGSFRGSKSQRSTEKESEKAQVGGVGADPSAFVSAEGAVAISEASAVDDTGGMCLFLKNQYCMFSV